MATSLNFMLDKAVVFITMDTLGTSPVTKKPRMYSTKFYVLQHLYGVMCGTGDHQLVQDWFCRIQTSMIARDIPHLDLYTPQQLRNLAKQYDQASGTTTIYQFGFSLDEGIYKGFAYRSINDFVSEPLPYRIAIKPYVPVKEDEFEHGEIHDAFRDLTIRQKIADDALPVAERLGIGGEIHFAYLCDKSVQVGTLYRFADYDSNYAAMLS
jgi:hypothetical protein